MGKKINQNGVSPEEIQTAHKVMSHLDDFLGDDMEDEQEALKLILHQLQAYEESSEWRDEAPSDTVDAEEYQTFDQLEATETTNE